MKIYHAPKFEFSTTPQSLIFFLKNGSYGYSAKSKWWPRRVHLGSNGVHWVEKMGQNRENLPCPKTRIFDHPAVIDFSKKMEVTVTAANHDGDPLGSIFGPMGSHWVQKMNQNLKKLPCPKIWIFDYPAVINFSKNMEVTVMAPNHGWDPLGSILGPMGSHWVQKWVKTVKITMPQNSNFRLPRSHRFFATKGSYGYGAKSRRGPPRVHLGSNGVPLGPNKLGQNRKKLPCPKFRIFDYPTVIDFSQNMEVKVMAPNHGGDPLRSIFRPMGSHWVKKMGRTRKKLPCPKIRIVDYHAVIEFSHKMEVTVMAPNHGGDPLRSIFGQMGSH